MTEMNTLTLPNNSLSSTLPPQWGMGALPKLERLNLSMNRLTGPFPEWGTQSGMAAMTTLDVSSNNLTGHPVAGSMPVCLPCTSMLMAWHTWHGMHGFPTVCPIQGSCS